MLIANITNPFKLERIAYSIKWLLWRTLLLGYRNQISATRFLSWTLHSVYLSRRFLFREYVKRFKSAKTRTWKHPIHQKSKKEARLYISECVSTHAFSIQRPCISISRKANFQMFFAKCFGNKNVTCCRTPILFLWCLRRKCGQSTFISFSVTPWHGN